jgi:hypothetical protein
MIQFRYRPPEREVSTRTSAHSRDPGAKEAARSRAPMTPVFSPLARIVHPKHAGPAFGGTSGVRG